MKRKRKNIPEHLKCPYCAYGVAKKVRLYSGDVYQCRTCAGTWDGRGKLTAPPAIGSLLAFHEAVMRLIDTALLFIGIDYFDDSGQGE